MREFVDTNILVYAADATAGVKQSIAARLLDRLWRSGTGCLSVQVLQEFHGVVTRKLAVPLLLEASLAKVEYYSAWIVFAPSARDVVAAITLQMLYRLSFWDAMVLQGATVLECDTVWSEDLAHGQRYGNLTVRNPFLLSSGV